MTQHNASRDGSEVWLGRGHAVDGPYIVAMDPRETQRQEAYYLFFVASLGMTLNILVIAMIFIRRNLRRMTSAFLVHAGFLNLLKAGFCIPFGLNLLSDSDEDNEPLHCRFQGSFYIVLVTTSAINMVAMICSEAYTFGEVNVGGNAQGTSCCILFGLLVVYITSVILHLGPTLIGGAIKYNPNIGSCAFKLGHTTGYVANIMWIVIISLSFVGVAHFLIKLYREIQVNRPNRVSMLVRHSITICEERGRKPSACTVHEMTQEAMHRAKIFVITAVAFALCWYPLFLLIIIDIHFRVSPKVYQAFSFIAWTEALVEPIILICFDRNLNILARFMYCDREQYTAAQIAYLMAQSRELHRLQDHDDQMAGSQQSSMDDAFHSGGGQLVHHHTGECSGGSSATGESSHPPHQFSEDIIGPPNPIPCRRCCSCSPTQPTGPQGAQHNRIHQQVSGAHPPLSRDDNLRGFREFQHRRADMGENLEMNYTPYRGEMDFIARKHKEDALRHGDIQC